MNEPKGHGAHAGIDKTKMRMGTQVRISQSPSAAEGTYVDKQAPRAVGLVFVVLALALAMLPAIGMLWAPTTTTTENRTLAEVPQLFDKDGALNIDILQDLGLYFDDHFAYRNEAVTANAQVRALLGHSATNQVVLGDSGWLYYGGTLPDYLGQNVLSDRALASIAHNLKLAQDYVESQGTKFVFTLAPNKNSLDASHMPYYYVAYDGASNAERLKPYLEESGVNYVDLFQVLGDEAKRSGTIGYLKHDSHWDNQRALVATQELLKAAGHEQLAIDQTRVSGRADFKGDLQSMLFPTSSQLEENYYFEGVNDGEGFAGSKWRYVEGSDVTDSTVKTEAADGGQGSVLVFRDSFGNAFVPFWAIAYQHATFSKLVPYNLAQLSQAKSDAVVIERAERHVDFLATDPPIMSNPARKVADGQLDGKAPAEARIEVEQSGSYWVVKGHVEGTSLSAADKLSVVATSPDGTKTSIEPFWTCDRDSATSAIVGDAGFLVYLPQNALDLNAASIDVYVN